MTRIRESVVVKFEGDAGDGVISMGLLAARAAARAGYHVFTYSSFLAVVRGGQSTFTLRIGRRHLLSQGDAPDIVVALNRAAVRGNGKDLSEGGLLLHPPFDDSIEGEVFPGTHAVAIDFAELALDETSQTRSQNIVAVGALLRVLDIDPEAAQTILADMFKAKGQEVVDNNQRAFEAGFNADGAHLELAPAFQFEPLDNKPRLLMSGNEAVALGALVGGVRFYGGYPITPASEIMEWLAKNLPRVGGRFIQAEDEIAALAMCIGASFGGVKTMTATSGPGLSLMTELLGLAGMAELPLVIVDVQRAGPSTGMPTKDGQGDLNIAIHGSHGEVPRVVIAPQSVSDCFEQTVHALNIAHEYHIPVVVLSSQSLSHRVQTIDAPDLEHLEAYKETFFEGSECEPDKEPVPFIRFKPTPDGRPSVRSVPGVPGGMYRTGGLEHDEAGNPCFDPEVRNRMVNRRRERMHAINLAFQDAITHDCTGDGHCPMGIMSWGGTASAVREVVEDMHHKGLKISYLLPKVLWPMPDRAVERFFASGVKTVFVCELNSTRQFAELIRARYTPLLIKHGIKVISIRKDDGIPFSAKQIAEGIAENLTDDMVCVQSLGVSAEELRGRILGDSAAVKG